MGDGCLNEKVEAVCYEERGLAGLTESESEVIFDLIDCPVLPVSVHSDAGFPLALGEDSGNVYWCNGVQWKMLQLLLYWSIVLR